jgi:hypothetical protein
MGHKPEASKLLIGNAPAQKRQQEILYVLVWHSREEEQKQQADTRLHVNFH